MHGVGFFRHDLRKHTSAFSEVQGMLQHTVRTTSFLSDELGMVPKMLSPELVHNQAFHNVNPILPTRYEVHNS